MQHRSTQTFQIGDVSSVTNMSYMSYMLYSATSFNLDISNWDVSSVTRGRYI
jgi:surface protein